MRLIHVHWLAASLLLWQPSGLFAQNPLLAESDLDFSRQIIAKYHFVAWVSLEFQDNKFTRYQYDHYPPTKDQPSFERIKCDDGVFARKGDQPWLKSDDWAETGKSVSDDLTAEFVTYVSAANAMLEPPVHHALSQGGTVWKYIGEKDDDKSKIIEYTYERSREHPRPDGVYPQYTFVKYPGDTDGNLFIAKSTGQMKSEDGHSIPVLITYTYLVPLPPGATVKYYHDGKEVYHETVPAK